MPILTHAGGFVHTLLENIFPFHQVFWRFSPPPALFFAEARRKRESATRKEPNARRRSRAGRCAASSAAAAERTSAGKTRKGSPSFLRSPFFACTERASAAIGKKERRLTPCAAACGTPQKQRQKGDERRPPAHAHAAQDPAQDAAQKEEIKAHGRSSLTPAANMTSSNKRETALNESFPKSFAPNAPPRSTPNATGKKDAHGHEPFDKIDGAAQERGGRNDGDRRRVGVLFFEPRALQNGHGEHAPSPAQQPVDGADTRSPPKDRL